MTDKEIENLWDDLTDIPFYEDDNGYCLYDNLYLDVDWYIFKKDTSTFLNMTKEPEEEE